jgi:hypothetical protein
MSARLDLIDHYTKPRNQIQQLLDHLELAQTHAREADKLWRRIVSNPETVSFLRPGDLPTLREDLPTLRERLDDLDPDNTDYLGDLA